MADARKDKRTLLSLKIRYKSATLADFIERYSMDISRGGVFIKAKKPLAVGTLLKFEFMLQDQSTLIHGVGRVVWRREEHEADEQNPSGMGIKFIKMDPDSRSVVQRIVEDRALPGVFEQGKDGVPSEPVAAGGEATKVRHVSEFLASALEEGHAGEVATREAQASVRRARQASQRPMARGAFSASADASRGRYASTPESPARGAMSAFGSASAGVGGRTMSSAAPAMDDLDAEDDFLENETTKVQELPSSDFPDADATVVTPQTPLLQERKQTPVVPASPSALQEEVPDLFGPDSFGPAPGELIDASLLDPAVATVPPKASALPRGAVPDAAGVAREAFKVPPAPAPVAPEPPAAAPQKTRGWLVALLMLILLAAAGLAAWKLGLLDDWADLVLADRFGTKAPVVQSTMPAALAPAAPKAPAEPLAVDEVARAEAEQEVVADEATPADVATSADGMVKLTVVSVPSGAWVSIDGKGVGRAPVTVEKTPGSKLSIYTKARGFLGRRQRVNVEPARSEVKLILTPLPYVVHVVSEPAGATASAVGGGQTTTPGVLEFSSMPKSRKIVISKSGYTTTTALVTRGSFIEEKDRMAATVRVRLAAETAGAPVSATDASSSEEPAAATPSGSVGDDVP